MTFFISKKLVRLTFIFGWLPAFILAVLCGSMLIQMTSAVIIDAFTGEFERVILFIVNGVWAGCGLFGFWGLSSVIFKSRLQPATRIGFLSLGIIASMTAVIFLCLRYPQLFDGNFYTAYFAVAFSLLIPPVIFAVVHIVLYWRVLKRNSA